MRVLTIMALLWSSPAAAFVCTRASTEGSQASGPALSWFTRTPSFTLQSAGSRQIPLTNVETTLRNAFLVWQNLTLSADQVSQCGANPKWDLVFKETPTLSNATWVGYNFLDPNSNENLLLFRDNAWPNPTTAIDVIALTTSTYSALTGEIIDADIEFNSANFNFVTQDPNTEQVDLLNAAVHEIGHFIGLAHCDSSGCQQGEVMQSVSNPGEIVKRQLKCSDRAGAVLKYPAGLPNGYCTGDVNTACGFCAPPTPFALKPNINLNNQWPGRAGCAASGGGLATLWVVSWLLRRRRYRLRACAALLCMMAMGACGSVECNGQPAVLDPNAPMIVAMSFTGQVADDPWRVILATDFVDYNGDLGGGHVEFFANRSTTAASAPTLDKIFDSSGGILRTAINGRLALPLRFAQATPDGSSLHLGTQLVDAAGLRSNCYTMDFGFRLTVAN